MKELFNMETFLNSLLARISHYHIMTYMIPGCALCFILTQLGVHIFSGTVLVDIVICYLVGLVNGRLASIVVEPLAKATHLITFDDHARYRAAKGKYKFIDILNEDNNMYRSFVSVFLVSVIVCLYQNYVRLVVLIKENGTLILLLALLVLFLLSYRKQTEYTKKHINEVLGESDSTTSNAKAEEQDSLPTKRQRTRRRDQQESRAGNK